MNNTILSSCQVSSFHSFQLSFHQINKRLLCCQHGCWQGTLFFLPGGLGGGGVGVVVFGTVGDHQDVVEFFFDVLC